MGISDSEAVGKGPEMSQCSGRTGNMGACGAIGQPTALYSKAL